jgi:hypothetical protein
MSNNRIYATFDEVAIGSDLALTDGDLTLKTVNNVDAHRMARSTFAVTEASYVEFVIFSPNGTAPSLAPVAGVPPVIVGFTSAADHVASNYIGEGADGIGYCPGDGYLYNEATQLQFIGTATYGDTITLVIDPANPIDASITVFKNGAQLGGVSVSQYQAWHFAATVSGIPGAYAINANTGKTPQRHPFADLFGFSKARTTISPVYVATEPFISKSTDKLPNNKYAGDVDVTNSVMISRGMRPWMFGRSAPPELGGQTQVEIRLNDPNGVYRNIKSTDLRDLPISISRVAQDTSQDSAEAVFTAIVDKIGRPNDFQLTLYGKDKLALLQSQLVRPLFPPSVDAAFAGKPRPLALGICRTFMPALYDAAGLNWALSCGPVTAVGLFRVAGKPDVFGVDETLNADGASVHRATAPAAKFTAETSSIGAAFSVAAPDALIGSGDFSSVGTLGGGQTGSGSTSVTIGTGSKTFNVGAGLSFVTASQVKWTGNVGTMTGTVTSYSGSTLTVNVTSTTGSGSSSGAWHIDGGVNQPTGWAGGGMNFGVEPPGTVWQVQGTSPNKLVVCGNEASSINWLAHQTFTVAPGASYAFSIDVAEIPYLGPTHDSAGNPGTATPAKIVIGGLQSTNLAFMNWASFPLTKAGTYTGSFTNNYAVALPLTIGFLANEIVQGSNAGAYYYLKLRSVKLNSIASLTSNVTLQGLTLDQMLRALLIQYGPLTDADYDPTGAQAIDAATGYQYGLYIGEDETPQVMECVRRVLNSAGADLIVLRSGKVTAVRLIAPESVDPLTIAGSLTPTDIKGVLEPYEDMAENLTTRFDGCPNISPYNDSDFASVSTTAVAPAVREQLKRPFQWTTTAGEQLSPSYESAYSERPLPSQFDLQTDGQKENTRIAALYTVLRNFYVGTFFSPLGRQFEIGQVWNVTYPLPGLETGRQLLIVGMNESPSDETTQLIFWGL